MNNLLLMHHKKQGAVAAADPVQDTNTYYGTFSSATSGSVTLTTDQAQPYAGHYVYEAFDHNTATWFVGTRFPLTGGEFVPPIDIIVNNGSGNTVSFWKIVIGSNSGTYSRYFENWKIASVLGSSNGSTWDTVISRYTNPNAATFPSTTTIDLTGSAKYLTKYRYWKISIHDNAYASDHDLLMISDIDFYEVS